MPVTRFQVLRSIPKSSLVFPLLALAAAGCASHHIAANNPAAPSEASSRPEVTAASTNAPPSTSPSTPSSRNGAPAPLSGYSERGVASWYGQPFNGRRSANGEIYDMYKLTAAHRTLPFDTLVRVTNLSNGLHADVRITDRGPFVEDRVIDLSFEAARALGMIGAGTAVVRIDVLSALALDSGSFTVQIGAFSDRANAERLKQRLAAEYKPIFIQDFDSPTGHFFRVRVGSASSITAAQNLAAKLRADGGFNTFVIRLDEAPAANSHSTGGHP